MLQMQFRSMMQGELFRYARRGLSNTLKESSSDEFKQTVLMLKLMETRQKADLKAAENAFSAKADNLLRGSRMGFQALGKRLSVQEDLLRTLLTALDVSHALPPAHAARGADRQGGGQGGGTLPSVPAAAKASSRRHGITSIGGSAGGGNID